MSSRPLLALLGAMATACASSFAVPDCEDVPRVFACESDDGATEVEGHSYALEPAVSGCALCRMAELAFRARSDELECCEPFPLDTCPLEELGPVGGCFLWQAEMHADFLRTAFSCQLLVRRAGTLRNWSGFECGGRFCYVPPLEEELVEDARAFCGDL